MALSEEGVGKIVAELLEGLDADTLDYVSGGVAPEGSLLEKDELVDFVAPLLEACM